MIPRAGGARADLKSQALLPGDARGTGSGDLRQEVAIELPYVLPQTRMESELSWRWGPTQGSRGPPPSSGVEAILQQHSIIVVDDEPATGLSRWCSAAYWRCCRAALKCLVAGCIAAMACAGLAQVVVISSICRLRGYVVSVYVTAITSNVVCASCALLLLARGTISWLKSATACCVLLSVQATWSVLRYKQRCIDAMDATLHENGAVFDVEGIPNVPAITTLLIVLPLYWMQCVVIEHIKRLEDVVAQGLGMVGLKRLRAFFAAVVVGYLLLPLFSRHDNKGHMKWFYHITMAVLHCLFLLTTVCILMTPLKLARRLARGAKGGSHHQVSVAVLRQSYKEAALLVCLTAAPFGKAVMYRVQSAYDDSDTHHWFFFHTRTLPAALMQICLSLCIVLLSGALRSAALVWQAEKLVESRELSRRAAAKALRKCVVATGEDAWYQEGGEEEPEDLKPLPASALAGSRCRSAACRSWWRKARELASRGFTLEALLHFYKRLGVDCMPHYTASVHTTRDVVRQAIIPLSSEGACAFATLMMNGRPTRPRKLVTHTWNGLFRDLVAAVVADALGECDYSVAAACLEASIPAVEEMLRSRDALQNTYWICAFSISQHGTICTSVEKPEGGREVDPVTEEGHPRCDCGTAPINGTTEPTHRGRSTYCETNKWSDMLRLLAATDEDLTQIIVVDRALDLFDRAWCVTELDQARRLGVRQHLQLLQPGLVGCPLEHKLMDFRVESAKASRREDQKALLAQIPNKDTFNLELKTLMLGQVGDKVPGLVPTWRASHAAQNVELLGRFIRWQLACKSCGEEEACDKIWHLLE